MSSDKITDIIKMQLDKMPKWNITSMTLTGSGGNDYTSVFPDKKVYVMIPDEETIKDAMEALQAVRDGKILESSYEENTSGDVNTPFHVKPTPKPKDETTEETKDENSSVDSNDAKDEEIIDDETTKPNDTTTETPEDNNNQENSKPELDNNTSTDTSEDNSNSDNSTDNTEPNDILDVPGLVN